MPVDIADLFAPTDALTVPFATGAKVELTYSRLDVTSNLVDPASQDVQVLAKAVAAVVRTWDIASGGTPVDPTNVVTVAALPLAFLQVVLKAILRDQNIDPN